MWPVQRVGPRSLAPPCGRTSSASSATPRRAALWPRRRHAPCRRLHRPHTCLLAPLYDVARSLVSYRNTHTQRTQKIAQNLTWRAVTTASGAANTHRSAKSGRAETTAAQPALGGMLRDSFRMYHQSTRSGDNYTRRCTGVPSSRAARVRHRARGGSPGPSTQRLKSFSRLSDTSHTFGADLSMESPPSNAS